MRASLLFKPLFVTIFDNSVRLSPLLLQSLKFRHSFLQSLPLSFFLSFLFPFFLRYPISLQFKIPFISIKKSNTLLTHTNYFFYYKIFVVGIIMQLDISVKLTSQVTTIICHYIKKNIIKKRKKERKYKNMEGLDQNTYVNTNDT